MNDFVHIVIPIYKSCPDQTEIVSLKQAIGVLGKYKFKIVTHAKLNLGFYKQLLDSSEIEYDVCFFDESYFRSIEGYNRLLLSREFYERFSDAKYILIYQLDAYVFRDELEYWCGLDYDYIGAPWVKKFIFSKDQRLEIWKVGNGGLSLRKTKAFIDRFNYPFPVKRYKGIWQESEACKKPKILKQLIKSVLKILERTLSFFEYKNTMGHYSLYYPSNEDSFWCLFLENTKIALKIPAVDLALKFAIEMGASQLYKEGKFQLPFGCHAWEKYEPDFWRQFIPSAKEALDSPKTTP